MKKLNYNLPQRKSIRLKNFDYTNVADYFVTICCYEMHSIFGEIHNGEIQLNEFGKIAYKEWERSSEIRENIKLGEFVIMPNHMHGIIRITHKGPIQNPAFQIPRTGFSQKPVPFSLQNPVPFSSQKPVPFSPQNPVELSSKMHTSNLPPNSSLCGPAPNSLGAIILGYKSTVTRQIRQLGFTSKVWHRNYYENIIRTEEDYFRISEYIKNNPRKWSSDKFYCK